MKIRTLASIFALVYCTASVAQKADVTFFVIGKHENLAQDVSGNKNPVDYSFFSEIFLTAGGDASAAVLQLPTGERVDYSDMRNASGGDRDNLLLVSGEERFDSFAALQNRYPDGMYRVSFDSPSGNVANGELVFRERPLPQPPRVTVSQGDVAHCRMLAPHRDLQISWDPFAEGRPDANGILDDLIFVILTDVEGNRVAHSGRPFEGKSYLTYADNEFTITGSVLEANQTYHLSVEHAMLDDSTRFDGIPAFTTRAVTTGLDLVTGHEDMETCTPMTPPIDSQVTMFYYKDIGPATHFYGDILGLEETLDWSWIRFFRTGPSSFVGLVTEGDRAWHKVQPSNAVMLSLVTDDVDAWQARLGGRDDVKFLKSVGGSDAVRSLLIEDPGGYTVEFFQWLTPPE